MQQNEHKRHKHGQQPGDLAKETKIRMIEDNVSPYPTIMPNAAKTYKRFLSLKSKTQQRQRDAAVIQEQLTKD